MAPKRESAQVNCFLGRSILELKPCMHNPIVHRILMYMCVTKQSHIDVFSLRCFVRTAIVGYVGSYRALSRLSAPGLELRFVCRLSSVLWEV